MSPAARASAAPDEDLPPGSSSGIDAPLSPRTRVVMEELCLEASPPTLPQEGEHQIQSQETEIARDDPYVPQEFHIPLGEDGQPGPWCSFHLSDKHNIDDCHEFRKRPSSEGCHICGELGHFRRDCPLNPKPRKAPKKKKSPRTVVDASSQTDNSYSPPMTPVSQPVATPDWDRAYFNESQPGKEWDLSGHIVTIHPGPSGPPQKYWIAKWLASGRQ